MPLTKSKKNESIFNTTFIRYLSPNINTSSTTPSSNHDNYFTPTPTPSPSKNSLINPIPSTSCKSAFSIQSFHTASGDYENEDDDQFLDDTEITKKTYGSTLFVVDEEGSSSKKPNTTNRQQKHQHRPKMVSTSSSSTTNDLFTNYPNGLSTTTTNNSTMIHPTSLSHSYTTSNSISSNFFYYGSLDSNTLAKSPSESYTNEYHNGEYEVVLDDGTLQKRSVSLSTMPVLTPLEFNKRKLKGNYNHLYFQNNRDYPNQQNSASRSQAKE